MMTSTSAANPADNFAGNRHSSWRQFRLIFAHEGRVLVADRTLWWVLGLLLSLTVYGLYTGLLETRMRDQAAKEFYAAEQAAQQSNLTGLRQVMAGIAPADPFSNPADPATIGGGMAGRYAVMPTAPLAPLAFGQSDMFPNSYPMSFGSKVSFMYDSEMENPWNLFSGHVDLAFVIVYLLPLLIFALSYNLLSAEREQGTLRMLLTQPLSLLTLLLAKVAVRASALLSVPLVLPLVLLLLLRPETRTLAQLLLLGSWVLLVVAYAAFWFALATLINVYSHSSAVNALLLAGLWVVLVLIMPVTLNLVVEQLSPAPSRTELATATRLITIAGLEQYNDLLSTDYRYAEEPMALFPQDGKFAVQPRARAHYLIDRDVDAKIDVVLDTFDAQLAGQQQLVDRYGLLSPAITLYEGMTALAGTGSKRYLHFKNQVDDFHQEWKAFFQPKMDQSLAITEADLNNLPTFVWQETQADGTANATWRRILQLLVPGLLLLGVTWRQLRRYQAV
jgi:ABC-2 type transport system permease protein